MDVLGEQGAAPLLEQDVAVPRAVPHLQGVVGRLRVEHDEVQTVERAEAVLTAGTGPRATRAPGTDGTRRGSPGRSPPPPDRCLRQRDPEKPQTHVSPGASESYLGRRRTRSLWGSALSYVFKDPNNSETARSSYDSKLSQPPKSEGSLTSLCFKQIKDFYRRPCGSRDAPLGGSVRARDTHGQ